MTTPDLPVGLQQGLIRCWSRCWSIAAATPPLLVLVVLVAAAMLLSLGVGRYPLPLSDIIGFLTASCGWEELPPARHALLFNLIVRIRLPRVLAAVLVGAALSVSGAAYQAVFRNPLVSPGLLGALAGAAFGAALGILMSGPWWLVQLLSFGMGVLAVMLCLLITRMFGAGSLIMLVLGGVLSSGLFSSLLSMVKYAADPYNQLPTIVYWLMGSMAQVQIQQLAWFAFPMGLGIVALILLGRALDALSLGDDEALSLGVSVRWLRFGVIAAATLVSALTVSLVGMIAWVGLVVPHMTRLMVGPGNARLLPASCCMGALFLLAADALSRTLGAAEIPIGIVTELIGIPVFLLVLGRARRAWA